MHTSIIILWTMLAAFGADTPYVDDAPFPDEPIDLTIGAQASRATSSRDPLAPRTKGRRSDKGRRIWVPPLRLDSRAAFRDQMAPAAVIEVGAQLTRKRAYAVDMNLSYTTPHGVLLPGPWRSFSQVNLDGDLLFDGGRFLKFGPSAGLGYRIYQQQFQVIDEGFVPQLGLRASSGLLQARKWSLVVTARATVDLVSTNLVMETAQVHRLSPYEGQIGLRFNFGHGHMPEAKP